MWKVLKFFVIAAILLAVAWGIASLPGTLSINAARYQINTPVPVAVVAVLLLLVLVLLLSWLLRALRKTPTRLLQWRGQKRQLAGDTALQHGLVAIAAGDAAGAQKATSKARNLLGDTPLVQWLGAEAARIGGQTEDARAGFERLTQSKNMKFLGHQGLLRETMQAGEMEDAAQHAAEAESAWPGGDWTRQQRLALALKQQNYPVALTLAGNSTERAALAVAAAKAAPTPQQALKFSKLALKADARAPMVPATLAQALRDAGKNLAARKVVKQGWVKAPSAQLAAAWFTPEATKLERAKDAIKLATLNPGHVESELLLAQTSFEAQLSGEARAHAQKAKALGNADGRAEAILAQLDNLPAPAPTTSWHCTNCQTKQESWLPVCPACGKIGSVAFNEA